VIPTVYGLPFQVLSGNVVLWNWENGEVYGYGDIKNKHMTSL
jgi:hypothetical protein